MHAMYSANLPRSMMLTGRPDALLQKPAGKPPI